MILESCFDFLGYVFGKKDVNIKDADGNTPLYYACMNASVQLVYFLLSRGADPTTKCSNNDTALHMAFKDLPNTTPHTLHNQALIISDLIIKGADLNALNRKKQTPIAFGSSQLLKILDLNNFVALVDGDIDKEVLSSIGNTKLFEIMGVKKQYEPEMLRMSYQRLNSYSTACSSKIVHYEPKTDLNIYERR